MMTTLPFSFSPTASLVAACNRVLYGSTTNCGGGIDSHTFKSKVMYVLTGAYEANYIVLAYICTLSLGSTSYVYIQCS